MTRTSARTLTRVALCMALIAVCSWISVPLPVPFTLQTFGIFCTLGLLGGKNGTVAVLGYIFLGLVGIPVFAGFQGGPAVLLGPTGGYILGFLGSALLYWAITARLGTKLPVQVTAMLLGLLVCYVFGTAWFLTVYTRTKGAITLHAALGWCVFPFLLPDAGKLGLALLLTQRLRRFLPQ